MFPKARISTKYLQNQIITQGCEVVDQYFYDGSERREYCRCGPVPFTQGHCRVCNLITVASKRLRIAEDHMETIFAFVGGFSCKSRPMISRQNMIGQIMVMAKTWSRREHIISVIQSKYHCSENLISTAIDVLIKRGKLYSMSCASVTRLALPSSTLDKDISNSWQYRDEEIWNRLALEFNIGKMIGHVQETLCRSDRIMYIGEEYCSEAFIAILTRPQVYVCALYETTHHVKQAYGISYFRHKKWLFDQMDGLTDG